MYKYSDNFWEGDGFNLVIQHIKDPKRIELLIKLLKVRIEVESNYAKDLQKFRKLDSKIYEGSTGQAFEKIKQNAEEESTLHSDLAKNLKELIQEIQKSDKAINKKLKPYVSNAEKIIKDYKTLKQKFIQADLKLHKASAECTEIEAKMHNTTDNVQIAKLKVQLEKQKEVKRKAEEEHESKHRKLEQNKAQYIKKLTIEIDSIQEIEVERIEFIKSMLSKYSKALKSFGDAIPDIVKGLSEKINEIDPHKDIDRWIEHHRTGNERPDGSKAKIEKPKPSKEKKVKESSEKGSPKSSKEESEPSAKEETESSDKEESNPDPPPKEETPKKKSKKSKK